MTEIASKDSSYWVKGSLSAYSVHAASDLGLGKEDPTFANAPNMQIEVFSCQRT